jgi:uncharacterized protein (DUF433 family)
MSVSSRAIEHRNNRDGQSRAFIAGTRVRVQDIYGLSELQGLTPEEIVQSLPHLSLAQVHAALAYYFEHRDEVLSELREDEEYIRQFRQAHGEGPLATKLRRREADGDTFSP